MPKPHSSTVNPISVRWVFIRDRPKIPAGYIPPCEIKRELLGLQVNQAIWEGLPKIGVLSSRKGPTKTSNCRYIR